jgi:hypothetical protein
MRQDGWEVRLADAVDAVRNAPFQWGQHDCATWAADVRLALTGQDAAAAWRGRYKSERGALRAMRRMGFSTLEAGVTGLLGAPLPTPLLAQRGDVVLHGEALGVCIGATGLFLGPDGLTELPIAACRLAWRV